MLGKLFIKNAIQSLNIQNKCVCIHSSFKSFGCHVEGGAEAVIAAFLEEQCIVMVPAFDDGCEIYPPKHLRPKQNGTGDDSYFESKRYGTPKTFSVNSNDITSEDMGLIPTTLINMPARRRGYHPLNSFAAIGSDAAKLIERQSDENVWAPFEKLCELNGMVLLIGVGLHRATIIHYAEQLAGRVPFVRWANDINGVPATCNTGGCSHGFNNFDQLLSPIEKNIVVGKSLWKCFPAKDMADICSAAIHEKPVITHCHDPNCERCNDAILGGPIWDSV